MRAGAILLASICGACARGPGHWTIPLEAEAVVLVASGAGTSRIVDARPAWVDGATLRYSAEAGDDQLTLIALSAADLLAIAPERDPDRPLRFALSTEAICAQADGAENEQRRRLPPDLPVWVGGVDDPQPTRVAAKELPALALLELQIPVREERCRLYVREEIIPFGSELSLRPPGADLGLGLGSNEAGNPMAVLWDIDEVTPSRVVAVAYSGLYVVDRGEPPLVDGDHFLPATFARAGDSLLGFREAIVDPLDHGHVVVFGNDGSSVRIELRLGPPLRVLSTDHEPDIKTGAFDANGDLYVGGKGGLFVRPTSTTTFTRIPFPQISISRIWRFEDNLIVSGMSVLEGYQILIGKIGSSSFQSISVTANVASALLATTGGQLRGWFGLANEELLELSADLASVSPLVYAPPAAARPCASLPTACGFHGVLGVAGGLSLLDDQLLLTPFGCSGLILVRPSDGCARAIVLGGESTLGPAGSGWTNTLRQASWRATVVGSGLRVGEMILDRVP